jgi:hypothetical protein
VCVLGANVVVSLLLSHSPRPRPTGTNREATPIQSSRLVGQARALRGGGRPRPLRCRRRRTSAELRRVTPRPAHHHHLFPAHTTTKVVAAPMGPLQGSTWHVNGVGRACWLAGARRQQRSALMSPNSRPFRSPSPFQRLCALSLGAATPPSVEPPACRPSAYCAVQPGGGGRAPFGSFTSYRPPVRRRGGTGSLASQTLGANKLLAWPADLSRASISSGRRLDIGRRRRLGEQAARETRTPAANDNNNDDDYRDWRAPSAKATHRSD